MKLSLISLREIIGVFAIALLFLGAAYYSNQYEVYLRDTFLHEDKWGILLYIAVTATAVVIAPISTFPLLPVAVTLWGSFTAALLSVLGWTIGGVIAFVIARELGRPIVQRFVDLRKAQQIALAVSGGHLFWSVVLLRIILPVDLLSYALGLFVRIPLRIYSLATLIGVVPFAFIFAYTVPFSTPYQVIALIIAALFVVIGYLHIGGRIRRAKEQSETDTKEIIDVRRR
jgi:uncharacterized membrane protein YdjX (TVP38/TMEM64 family)